MSQKYLMGKVAVEAVGYVVVQMDDRNLSVHIACIHHAYLALTAMRIKDYSD